MKKFYFPIFLIALCLILSGWGYNGHKKISQNFAICLPLQMSFLNPVWTNFVANHASDADYRKDTDPNESPRHFIDIDNYPEFVQTGQISQNFDSVVAQHGLAFVISQGILPWAAKITFDSLKNCFLRCDWDKSAFFAADLGHYIGDGHQPLHITKNYNGQMTGQYGVHSRYEKTMVDRFQTQIVYPADSVRLVGDVQNYIFEYLYNDYTYVDSLLAADAAATIIAGNTSSDAYYQALWTKTGNFTIKMMRNASNALASLIYTAWVEAGSPMMYPTAIDEPEALNQTLLIDVYPNPAIDYAWFQVVISKHPSTFTFRIYDGNGNLKDTLVNQSTGEGSQKIRWAFRNLAPGVYICVIQSGNYRDSMKFIIGK
ncbi:MAG: T9SS type A sorting domain-containing protein [Bacteroidota bacterium]